ncbi:MAG: hypothetical protein LUD81_07885 [Clostridiales bacterium]|nr:hypothetical protein [Clostridiales bacterium]
MYDFIIVETMCASEDGEALAFSNGRELIRIENIVKAYLNCGGGRHSEDNENGDWNICIVAKDIWRGEERLKNYFLNFDCSDKSYVLERLCDLQRVLNREPELQIEKRILIPNKPYNNGVFFSEATQREDEVTKGGNRDD